MPARKSKVKPTSAAKEPSSLALIGHNSLDEITPDALSGGDGGEDQATFDTSQTSVLATPETRATVQELVALQKRRVLTIKEVNGSISRIEHLIVDTLVHGGTEKERKAAFVKARAYRTAVERGADTRKLLDPDPQSQADLAPLVPLILQSAMSRTKWPELRKKIEKDMERLAQTLPGAQYVKSVKGLGWLGFGVICAEAVIPIAEYRTVSGLWKHMGFAVIDGRRQQGIPGKRKDKEEAMKLFHPKERRGQLYGFLQDALFRQQWNAGKLRCVTCKKMTAYEWDENGDPVCAVCETRGEVDEVTLAHPADHYGEIYARRRDHTAPRILATDHLDPKNPARWSLKRCHSDGTRIMAKAVLRDLWRVSRGLPRRSLTEEGQARAS